MNVASPCIHVCQLDGAGVCAGCFRTLDEIARWTQMSSSEKASVLNALADRRENLTASKGNESQ